MESFDIILIEDNINWVNEICNIINARLQVKIHAFDSFDKAENQISSKMINYDLLITDIFESDEARDQRGIQIAEFAHKVDCKPVIVLTGYSRLIVNLSNQYKYIDFFDKTNFKRLDFLNNIISHIKNKNDKMPEGPTNFNIA